jgi:glycine/D-amino acid oxidase-like deaminating enzyme
VLILDRGPIAGGTTAAGMGHIVVMDDSEAQFALTNYSRQLWQEILPQLPKNVEYDLCGTLWVAADAEEMNEVKRKEKYYSERGVSVEVLNENELRRAEPQLRAGLAGGLRVPEDGVVYPPCAARFLLEQAMKRGAELRCGVAVRSLSQNGTAILKDGTEVPCGRCVNAAGPWSPELNAGLPVRKRKGHLVITDRYPGFVRHQLVELGYLKSAHSTSSDSVAFNIQPRITGQMLIGSSRQFDAEDSNVDQPLLNRMLARAFQYLPGLEKLAAIRAWTGHRAATPDKLPIIGPSQESDRIWLATGHEGLGITTSLATGRLLADQLLGRASKIPVLPYSPARFRPGHNTVNEH